MKNDTVTNMKTVEDNDFKHVGTTSSLPGTDQPFYR